MNVNKLLILFSFGAQAINVCAQNVSFLDSLSIASDLFNGESYEEAEKLFDKIEGSSNKASTELQIYYNYIKGCNYYFLSKPSNAIPSFDKAVKMMEERCDTLGQDYYECMHGLGSSYLSLGDTVMAEKHWRHAFIRSLNTPKEVITQCGVLSDIITSLGDIYNTKGDSILARDIYFYATQVSLMMIGDSGLDKLSPEVLDNYVDQKNAEGLELLKDKHYTDAIKLFSELIQLCEDNDNTYWQGILFHNIGRTLMLQEDYDKALQTLEKASKIQISVSGRPMEKTITYINECKARL